MFNKVGLKLLLILQNRNKWDSSSINWHILFHNLKLPGILFYLPVSQALVFTIHTNLILVWMIYGNLHVTCFHSKRIATISKFAYYFSDFNNRIQGRIQGEAHPARAPPPPPPLKLEKIWFFCVKSWFFTRNTPTIFVPPSTIGKNKRFFA
jgi:hypothetical protein